MSEGNESSCNDKMASSEAFAYLGIGKTMLKKSLFSVGHAAHQWRVCAIRDNHSATCVNNRDLGSEQPLVYSRS